MSHLEHPYSDPSADGEWVRGNLHAHSTHSDGKLDPQAVIDLYAGYGHGFLMLSDHDTYFSPADCAGLEAHGLVLIPGNEISSSGPHLLHVNPNRLIPPRENRQEIIDEIKATQGFAIINHPNWQSQFNHCPQELLESWQGFAGLEIYNGVIGRLQGSPYATDRWDMLLSQGRRVWGYAHDDSHREGDSPLGCNVVCVPEHTLAEIVTALAAGRFYASTSVNITRIRVEGMNIAVATENAERIVALTDGGARFAVADSSHIEVEAPADKNYVRFECWGRGESFAWTQPFFVVADNE